jgi:hypothetical protein
VLVAPGSLSQLVSGSPSLVRLLAQRVAGVLLALALVAAGLVELGLGLAMLAARDWARLLLMGAAVVTTVVAFASHLTGSSRVTLLSLPATATAVLLLLALTSHRAREYASRGRARPVRP